MMIVYSNYVEEAFERLPRSLKPGDYSDLRCHIGRVEVVRDDVLEEVTFPMPASVRAATHNPMILEQFELLKKSENISRDFHQNKLADWVREVRLLMIC